MKLNVIIKCFLFIIVSCVATFQNEIVINKRDNCTNQAVFEVLESIASDPLLSLKSLAGLSGEIFSLISTSNCDLLSKLNEISDQIKNITNLTECLSPKNEIQKINQELHYILNNIKQLDSNADDSWKKNNLICDDPNAGVNKIYSKILQILTTDMVSEYFRNCAKYKSSRINEWTRAVTGIAVLFTLAVKGCEEAYGYRNDFKHSIFAQEVSMHIRYYSEQMLLKQFSSDTSENGLRKSVRRVLNEEELPADDVWRKLNNVYGFYRWNVIVIDGRKADVLVSSRNSEHCNAEYFQGLTHSFFKHTLSAIVSWCVTNNQYDDKSFSHSLEFKEERKWRGWWAFTEYEIKNILGEIVSWYPDYLFVAMISCRIVINVPDPDTYNRSIQFTNCHTSYNYRLEGEFKQTEVDNEYGLFWMRFVDKEPKTFSAIHFFKNEKVHNTTEIKSYENVRLVSPQSQQKDLIVHGYGFYNFYKSIPNTGVPDCWKICKEQERGQCVAATMMENENRCYLYNNNSPLIRRQYDLVSYIHSSILNKLEDLKEKRIDARGLRIRNFFRLSNHYIEIKGISETKCWELCEKDNGDECVAIVHKSETCFLFNNQLTIERDEMTAYVSTFKTLYDSFKNTYALTGFQLIYHYKQIEDSSAEQCIKSCKDEGSNCLASMFIPDYKRCFLYSLQVQPRFSMKRNSMFISHITL